MLTVGSDGERPAELPTTELFVAMGKAAEKLKGWPRHASLNAIRRLKRAWLFAPIDPELAVFSAITAEEEAATALIVALKQRQYPNASQLYPREHPHKAGIYPFLRAMEGVLADCGFHPPKVYVDSTGRTPRVDIGLVSEHWGAPPGYVMKPDEPLNMSMMQAPSENPRSQIMDFGEQLQAMADRHGASDITKYIVREANERNRLLYASDAGWTVAQNVDPFLIDRRKRVVLLIGLTIAVLQSRKPESLAIQCLQAYLKALKNPPKAPVDFDKQAHTMPDRVLQVTQKLGEEPVAEMIVRPGFEPSPDLNLSYKGLTPDLNDGIWISKTAPDER